MLIKLGRAIITLLVVWLMIFGAGPISVQAATPAITINPTLGIVGVVAIVSGTGFSANETGIVVTYDGSVIASGITANGGGDWASPSFNIPASTGGSHIVDAYGGTTAATSVADITFVVAPAIALTATSGIPGVTTTTVTGTGFGNGEAVRVYYDSAQVTTATATTVGSWSAAFTIPASATGSHAVDADGSTTSESAVADRPFTVNPGIALNRPSGSPGSSITVTGAGFYAAETGITVTYDGTAIVSSIAANYQGGWTATFAVPASPAGTHVIDAYGYSTQIGKVADVTFTTGAGIFVDPVSGTPGTSVTVTGSGFAASESGIYVTYDGTQVVAGLSADAQGSWSTTFVTPGSRSGAHAIDAGGSFSLATSIPDITFTATPGISASKTGGAPGSSVSVTGVGFGAGEKEIVVTYDGTVVAQGISANAQGGWSATFIVPDSASGSHSISARGSVTQAASVSEASFNIGGGISLDPSTGYVGETVIVAGSGFASNSPLTFLYDEKVIPAQTVSTDSSGSFSQSVVIPTSAAGPHTLRVVDGQKNSSKITFTMESTPPPVPVLLTPKDGARLGLTGGTTPNLKWSSVTDPSGVTFDLQIDTNSDFSQPIFQKVDITGSHYTLTTADALPQGTYYWRVRAIDGAGNQSNWSQTFLLRSGFVSLPVLIVIIVLVVAIAAVVAYLLLKRRPRQRWEGMPIPEPDMPRIVPGQWRISEPEESRERPLPRLALPQPTRRAKPTLSTEDAARVKVIVDFAQSLPLVEAGYSSNWLVDLMETGMGVEASAQVYERLLKGELQLRYEPAWMRHPTYQDLAHLLQGQPILQDLNAFVDSVSRCASDATSLLQEIYRDTVAEVAPDFLAKGGWGFVSGVYSDALSWFLGKSLREPLEHDYFIKTSEGEEEGIVTFSLWGEETTTFAGPLIEVADEAEATRLRALHLKLRRTYRGSDKARQLVGMMTQLEVQRSRLVGAFSQFSRLAE
ncbi:MAG: IPT/TIG domain-containing protein [Chloroflexota bacterium]